MGVRCILQAQFDANSAFLRFNLARPHGVVQVEVSSEWR